jgi:hypothetical protein
MGQAFGFVAQLFLGVDGSRGETSGMDATRRPVTEVERAIQAHTRAIARLINLLKHPNEAVCSEAAAALKQLDPPPTLALGEALLGSQDRALRLRIIKVLVGLATADQVRVLYLLCEAFKERRDLEVKRAAAVALMVLVPERSGPSPSPPEGPAPDPNREEYPRDGDKSSSERVAMRPSRPTGTRMNVEDPEHRVRPAEGPDGQGRGSGCRRSGPEASATA